MMTREEWIKKAKEIGYSKKKIEELLEEHDDNEKKDKIIIPYELLPLTNIIDN